MASTIEISESAMIAASMGLQNLQYEPQRLMAEANRLNAELEALVMDNYRIFVENLTCSVHLRTEDKKLGEISEELEEKLKGLSQQCSAFRDRVNHFVNAHKRNRKTLQHHMQLVELLEVPQLVDACARNGFHEEALELAHFVNGLERRHLLAAEVRSGDGKTRGGSGVVQSIVDDVHSTLLALRQQLLHLLTESASLPKELHILATLRKLDGLLIDRQLSLERHENEQLARMTDKQREELRQHMLQAAETRLQMDFLEARTIWLERAADRALSGQAGESARISAAVEGIEESKYSLGTTSFGSSGSALGPYGRAIELLEVNRTSWFAVVTQFKALFEDNVSGTGSHPSTAILGAWATRQVQQLLVNLQQLLPNIDEGASLRAVLEQTLFFANRMSQVGCDFSGLAMPLFRDALVNRLTSDWRTASAHFKSMLATERFVIEVDDMQREQIIPLYLRQDQAVGDEMSPIKLKSVDEVSAPIAVMTYPPLAYLLNTILSGLNFLRECPLLIAKDILFSELSTVLQDSWNFFVSLAADIRTRGLNYLAAPGTILARNKAKTKKPVPVPGTDEQQEAEEAALDKLYARAIAQDFIPHVLICFESIFNASTQTQEDSAGAAGAATSSGKSKPRGKNISLRVEQLSAAKESINADSFALLSDCWQALRKAELIPDERPAFTSGSSALLTLSDKTKPSTDDV